MAEDEPQPNPSLLPYSEWTVEALRQVVASAVAHAAANGLPGEHHFFITFRTDHAGVVIPPRLRAQYAEVMTIVLQHQFWDLKLDPAANTISVGLSFGGVPTTLVVPLAAVTAFADPAVGFVLQFGDGKPTPAEPATDLAATESLEAEATPPAEEKPQVVSLEAFRRRPPSPKA